MASSRTPAGPRTSSTAAGASSSTAGDEGNEFKLDETRDSAALLLGRVTYEGFAAAWPSREGEFADKFNSMPKYVVSSTLTTRVDELDRARRRPRGGGLQAASEEADGDVVVHGSAQLAQTLIEHDLVDELRLMVFPVVLGTGKRLFGDPGEKKTLRLVDSKVVGDGVVILTYAAAPPA